MLEETSSSTWAGSAGDGAYQMTQQDLAGL